MISIESISIELLSKLSKMVYHARAKRVSISN